MGKQLIFAEWWKVNELKYDYVFPASRDAFEAGQQSRQAEVDRLKNLLEKDEYVHNLYYENANLENLIDATCKSINSFFDNQVSTPTPREYSNFIAELLGVLRGERE